MHPPLQCIHLFNYRNFTNHQENFHQYHTLFKGRNAVGKTNLLESISFLCPGTGFRKDSISNFSKDNNMKEITSIDYQFQYEDLSNVLRIELKQSEDRWTKQYLLNDKKIQQQQLLNIFQLFWFTEVDKVYFIKDTQYQRNTINRIACYYETSLFQHLNKYTKLRREKKKILQTTKEIAWLTSLDKQLLNLGEKIIEIKRQFLQSFQSFLISENDDFFQFEIIPSFGIAHKEEFMMKFEQNLKDESQRTQDHKLRSEHDPLKSIYEITYQNKNLSRQLCLMR